SLWRRDARCVEFRTPQPVARQWCGNFQKTHRSSVDLQVEHRKIGDVPRNDIAMLDMVLDTKLDHSLEFILPSMSGVAVFHLERDQPAFKLGDEVHFEVLLAVVVRKSHGASVVAREDV